MAAARALYAERGFESVSVDDVVRRAEVARGTFYIHFADIDGLRAAVAHELAGARTGSAPATNTRERST